MSIGYDTEHLNDLIDFVSAAPSSYHAAAEAAGRLDAQGWTGHQEADAWDAEPGGHYVLRDGSFVAWWIPDGLPQRPGFRIVGAHTDSPGFKLKPEPTSASAGWQQAGMEVYGGPLPNSWLDREFGLAGRLVLRDGSSRLVRTDPWLRIPQVAPHLDRSVHENLHLDRQAHLKPIFSVGHPELDLLSLVAHAAGIEREQILGHDLYAALGQGPAVFGAEEEFLASPRLDNLSSVHAGLAAILAADEGGDVMVLACFDHEEVGSQSRSGGGGPLLEQVLSRVAASLGHTGEGLARMLARSSCLSADAGHAVHPNYAGLHDPDHRPLVNGGPLLKHNANQRYTTDAASGALWRRACEAAEVPTQDFVSNNAVPCGSTIGPMTAARLGVLTADVGIPLLSMHSARELAGVRDPGWFADALTAYYSGA